MKRRTFIGTSAAATAGILSCNTATATSKKQDNVFLLKNNINHSVCQWCFGDIPLEDFVKTLKNLGIKAIDLIGPENWPLLKQYDISCSMCNGAEISLTEGWNNLKYHDILIKNYRDVIPQVAAAGYTNLICFSGNRDGMDDKTGATG